jgi:glycosyltransferase involved in cell wall biosynthesis
LTDLIFAYPGDLQTITGGYIYDRMLLAALRQKGFDVQELPLGDGFPHPSTAVRQEALQRVAQASTQAPVMVDGLALGAMPELAAAIASRQVLIALVHHPLGLETGLEASRAAALIASERQALSHTHAVLVTSDPTKETVLADFGVPHDAIFVAKPGVERPTHIRDRSKGGHPVRLLAVGQLAPRKGFDVLLNALAGLKSNSFTLDIAGVDHGGGDTEKMLKALVEHLGLMSCVRFLGAQSRVALDRLYHDADVFVLASLYEGYGMVYAEAMAHGLPVIGTTGGAIPSVVPASAGILAKPGDVESLRQALEIMILDKDKRLAFGAGAIKAAQALPTWFEAGAIAQAAIVSAQARMSSR